MAGAAVAFALITALASDFWILVLTTSGVYAITVLGLNLLTGYTGQVSFGHNAFLALGAYAAALGTTEMGLGPVPALLMGVGMSIAVALIVGTPALRLRGHYLALATLAFGLAVYAFVANSELTKGFVGISGIPPLSLLGLEAADPRALLVVIWVIVFASALSVWVIGHSRMGERLTAIKDDEDLASACGVNTHRVKVVVFAVSAVYASVAGSLQAFALSYVSPELFNIHTIALLFIILFIGGLTVWGSVIAAVGVTVAPQELSWLSEWQTSVFGVILLAILVLGPRVGSLRLPQSLSRLAALRGAGR
jgi:branched-chain amino acid transport system permease protein